MCLRIFVACVLPCITFISIKTGVITVPYCLTHSVGLQVMYIVFQEEYICMYTLRTMKCKLMYKSTVYVVQYTWNLFSISLAFAIFIMFSSIFLKSMSTDPRDSGVYFKNEAFASKIRELTIWTESKFIIDN